MRGTGWWIVGVVVLTAFTLSSCDEPEPLKVVSVEPAGHAAARNEPVVVRFSEDVDPDTPVEALVGVHDSAGRPVAITAAHGGRTVVLRPTDPWGWPGRTDLEVRVRRGRAVGFRGVSGAELAGDSEHPLRTSSEYIDYGAPMVLIHGPPQSLRDVGKEAVFEFEFSLPIDESSLYQARPTVALRYLDKQRRWFPTPVRSLWLSANGRTLYVKPWVSDSAFAVASEHELTIHSRRLSAITGRGLGRSATMRFWTSPYEDDGRFLDISFAARDVEDAAALGDAEFAHPVRDRVNVQTLDYERLRAGWVRDQWEGNDQVRQLAVMPLAREPSRFQLLIPGEALGEAPGMIEGLSWYAPMGVEQDLIFPRLRIRIGHAEDDQHLSDMFDGNFVTLGALDQHAVVDTIPAGSSSGELRVGASDGETWIDMPFEHPFRYAGGRRSIVVELRNDLGCYPAEPGEALSADFRGIPLCSGPPGPGADGARSLFAHATGVDDVGLTSTLVFSTKIRIERYIDVVSDWYEAEVTNPTWFIVPTADYLDATGEENEGFLFDYQGVADDGRMLPWGRLERLDGCRKIRARLRFVPVVSKGPDPRLEVRRLRVRYKDSAAR